ncbi:MAG: NAD(P)/FAD-dependent oxidoreductase [Chitinophagaceae bacterium]|nr:NAD(P)/FAD-dependent oxidoreductase [Chitinophagaceae bacterium]
MNKKKLIVIGGGAAGFFCAVNAARMNPVLDVVILEKTNKLLSKVKISGGGRCNVTHACFSIAEIIKRYPRGDNFLKKAFQHFFTTDTITWFKERGVELKTEDDGRMFPASNTSQTIIDCLVKEANKFGVEIIMNADVVEIFQTPNQFNLTLANGKLFVADFVCIASGGYPKSAQFEWLKKLGHSIENPMPSLFTFNIADKVLTALMGIVVENAVVKITGTKLQQQGPVLITHWGLSGPAVLKLSAWAAKELATKNYDFGLMINWLPDYNENSLRDKFQLLRFENAAQKIANKNPFELPNRFWEYLLKISGVKDDCRWADLPAKEQNKLVKNICTQEVKVKGKTTFKDEFVTAGGILLSEIDANTMQSKIVPNLFFAGEVINVDGITGGFNFQNAWTTGWIAAKKIASFIQ